MKKTILFLLIVYSVFADEHAVVFMYHRFGNEQYPSTNITKEQFVVQLEYLHKNNYNLIEAFKCTTALKTR